MRSVEVMEWLARYHIIAQHLMRDVEEHSLAQEIEQLRNGNCTRIPVCPSWQQQQLTFQVSPSIPVRSL